MLQTLEQINEQIPAPEAALDAALQTGEPSRPYRNEVARLEAELERCPIGLNRLGFRERRRCDSIPGFPWRRAGCPQPCQRICVSAS